MVRCLSNLALLPFLPFHPHNHLPAPSPNPIRLLPLSSVQSISACSIHLSMSNSPRLRIQLQYVSSPPVLTFSLLSPTLHLPFPIIVNITPMFPGSPSPFLSICSTSCEFSALLSVSHPTHLSPPLPWLPSAQIYLTSSSCILLPRSSFLQMFLAYSFSSSFLFLVEFRF